MTAILQDTLEGIEKRLRELEPAVSEHRQLQQAAEALRDIGTKPVADGRSRARPRSRSGHAHSAPAASRAAQGKASRRGRPRGSGKRAQQALEIVAKQPGITIPELAKAMKIQPNYLYRVLPALADDGKVVKKDKGWHPA